MNATDAYFAGIIEARGRAYVKVTLRGRRPHLEVMLRDHKVAKTLQAHFRCAGKITREPFPSKPEVVNFIFRVRGLAAL